MPQNCIRSGKSSQIYAIFTMFSRSEVSFLLFQIKQRYKYVLGVPSLG
jgi:hypothetical protein